ncbi:signal recognition particle-docking protein FtsY [Mesorhizobium sp. B1-1-8]|uniref:signal recognition particle-docking protein FtsY n=1 Tax=Mesorhizobium sp. B1-1-8 TaxID=2589976 RepID=UPI001127B7EF|nr:signal recognition particle-docking protein FtsY [Mesorhizobium sp. B1-1-8]UCI08314.1 signal recognition particle-docking protein FtsY [Mesorhizobium sp. B1-1-8]
MAGFFKKIFSFGKKEVVEERVDETAPLPPIKWDALEALKPAAEAAPQPVPEEPKPEPAPTIPPTPEPAVPSEPEPLPQPEPEEEPKPAPETPEPPVPEEIPVPPAVPEPTPEPQPQEVPLPVPSEPVIVPSRPERQPQPAPVEVPTPSELPAEPPAPEIPPAEVSPPIRQPAPIEPQPIRAEIAPEPEAVPTPQPPPEPKPTPSVGKVTVAKKVEQKAEPQKAPEPVLRRSWFQRMRDGLARSSRELTGNIAGVFTRRKLDEDTLQDLEDVLIRADLGLETALRVTDALASSRYGKDVSDTEVRAIMAAEVEKVLTPVAQSLELDLSHKPHVILVVGVNGTGKTTTIGKLAAKLTDGGLKVMLAAGDTFRAAAIEQLKIWGERTKSPVIASKLGADAAGLAYDAFERAKEAGSDVLIIDTAGRLQNKTELMAELEKIVRVLGKLDPEAPHTVLQTVDATTGQNALNQVEIFRNVAGVNGLVMTKLDGTARGGILVAIAAKHRLPVYFIGVGEQVDDLEPFSASEFARAIAGVA